MRPIFLDDSCKSYKTERFCSSADRNITLSVETQSDGSEIKTCRDINSCRNKEKCRYDK